MSTALKVNASEFLAESPVMDSPPVRALINSVLAGDVNFNGLERELFKILRESFVKVLVAVLEKIDDMLMHSAKRNGWRVHDRHQCEIESIVGPVNFKRRYYKRLTATGGYVYSHLLDDILGLDRGNITPRLAEIAVSLAAENSYRKCSKFLEDIIGVKISHETIRQEVQAAGEHISKWDKETGLDNTGRKEVLLLVIEVDGALVKRQKRKEPKKTREEDKNFELKTAVIYEGWEEKLCGEVKLKNPIYFVHGGNGKEFWVALERHLRRIYCLEGCQRIIVAGDGASWIREGAEELGAEYQYCRFHLERDLTRLFKETPEIKKSIKKTIQNNDCEGFNIIMDALVIQEESSQRKNKLGEFKSLLNSVWEGITDWRERNRPVPENARGLGVIESNVGHTIARRFKHQGASWSPQGAVNLAKVRCAVRNSNLIELMRLTGPPPVEKSSEVTKTEITNSYWSRREVDGLRKVDPTDWCKAGLPALYGPSQKERDLANLIGRLTLDWLH